jgi:hypothetical protein
MLKIVSKKVRDAARGQQCTLQIVGVCSYDTSTVVLAHLPDESHGMGRKSDDISACFACDNCHSVIDGRVKHYLEPADKENYMRRAMVRTWRKLVEMGVIKIEGMK